jgi:hypothetical protein
MKSATLTVAALLFVGVVVYAEDEKTIDKVDIVNDETPVLRVKRQFGKNIESESVTTD